MPSGENCWPVMNAPPIFRGTSIVSRGATTLPLYVLHSLSSHAYLDMLCPVQSRPDERAPSEPPGGAVSLSKLKALPVTRQVGYVM